MSICLYRENPRSYPHSPQEHILAHYKPYEPELTWATAQVSRRSQSWLDLPYRSSVEKKEPELTWATQHGAQVSRRSQRGHEQVYRSSGEQKEPEGSWAGPQELSWAEGARGFMSRPTGAQLSRRSQSWLELPYRSSVELKEPELSWAIYPTGAQLSRRCQNGHEQAYSSWLPAGGLVLANNKS
jgi:hypothetical protein